MNRAIRKYGIDVFTISPIARGENQAQLDNMEQVFIRAFQSLNPSRGYNGNTGGRHGWSITPDVVKRITDSHKAISAKRFGWTVVP